MVAFDFDEGGAGGVAGAGHAAWAAGEKGAIGGGIGDGCRFAGNDLAPSMTIGGVGFGDGGDQGDGVGMERVDR